MSASLARRAPWCALAATALLTFTASVAFAGPPWISVELPANPHDPRTRGALFVVHTYHHGSVMERSIGCALEGLVDGARRTIACRADETSRPGVYAVRGDVPRTGVWMVVVTGGDGPQAATALVDFAADGRVTGVRVPSRSAEGGRWTIPVPVTEADIEAALRTRWTALSSADAAAGHRLVLAGLGVALLGFGVVRRRMR